MPDLECNPLGAAAAIEKIEQTEYLWSEDRVKRRGGRRSAAAPDEPAPVQKLKFPETPAIRPFTATTIPPDDAQFLATRQFQLREIARLFRMPPHMLGDLEGATFSNISAMSTQYVTGTIMPWAKRWASEATMKLAEPGQVVRMRAEDLQMADLAQRTAAHKEGRMGGWLSTNEIRRDMGLRPIGPEGDTYLRPLNNETVKPAAQAHLISTAVVTAAVDRLETRERNAMSRLANKADADRDAGLARYFELTAGAAMQAFDRILVAFGQVYGTQCVASIESALASFSAPVEPDWSDLASWSSRRGSDLLSELVSIISQSDGASDES